MDALHDVPGADFEFGTHGPMYESEFGIYYRDDPDAMVAEDPTRYSLYDNKKRPNLVMDHSHVIKEWRRAMYIALSGNNWADSQ